VWLWDASESEAWDFTGAGSTPELISHCITFSHDFLYIIWASIPEVQWVEQIASDTFFTPDEFAFQPNLPKVWTHLQMQYWMNCVSNVLFVLFKVISLFFCSAFRRHRYMWKQGVLVLGSKSKKRTWWSDATMRAVKLWLFQPR